MVPERIMVSFSTVEMEKLADEAKRQERSISWIIRHRCFPTKEGES